MDLLKNLWRICKSDKSAFIGGVVILIYLGIAVFGPVFVHLSNVQNPAHAYLSPSWTPPPRHRLPGAGRADRDRARDPASDRGRAPGGDLRGRASGWSSGWRRATSEERWTWC